MNDKIKELKDLLFELDSKHSVSVPDTQQNINGVAKKIVKLFAIPVVNQHREQVCTLHYSCQYQSGFNECSYLSRCDYKKQTCG